MQQRVAEEADCRHRNPQDLLEEVISRGLDALSRERIGSATDGEPHVSTPAERLEGRIGKHHSERDEASQR